MTALSYTHSVKLQQAYWFIKKNGSPEAPVSMTIMAIHFHVSKRVIRRIVADLRLCGIPVVNSYDSFLGGYWIPESNDQVQEWKHRSLNRIRKSARLIQIASLYQPEIPGFEKYE